MRRERIFDLRDDKLEISRLTATERGDKLDEVVEVILRTDAERRRFEGDAGHDIDKGAGDVEEFFDLHNGQCIRFSMCLNRMPRTRPMP